MLFSRFFFSSAPLSICLFLTLGCTDDTTDSGPSTTNTGDGGSGTDSGSGGALGTGAQPGTGGAPSGGTGGRPGGGTDGGPGGGTDGGPSGGTGGGPSGGTGGASGGMGGTGSGGSTPTTGMGILGTWYLPTESTVNVTEYEFFEGGTGTYYSFTSDSEYGDEEDTYAVVWTETSEGHFHLALTCAPPPAEQPSTCEYEAECILTSDGRYFDCGPYRAYERYDPPIIGVGGNICHVVEDPNCPDSPQLCDPVEDEGRGERCLDIPEACGAFEDYEEGLRLGTSGDDVMGLYVSINFALEGNDEINLYNEGSCGIGGEGDDILRSHGENLYFAASPDILIGGPGNDMFVSGSPDLDSYPVIVDLEPGELIRISNHDLPGSGYFETIAGFDLQNSSMSSASTRAVFDPTTGILYADSDGSGTTSDPRPMFTILGSPTIVESQIVSGGFLDD